MKKSLLITTGLLTLGVVTGIYAQTTGATGTIIDKMKAVAHGFTLSASLNPTDTGLSSDPIKGKKTGDILTAGEYNRLLELVSEGGSGGGTNSSSIKAWITYRNLAGAVTIVGTPYGIQSATSGAGVTNFLYYDTIITLKEPLLDSNYAVVVSPAFNNGSGYYNGNVLDWVCIWSKISSTSLGVHCAYPGFGAYGNSIVSVAVVGEGAGSGGSSGWVDVPLTDTASYDHNGCQYRAKITGPAYNATYGFSSDAYYPADYVSAGALMLDSGIFIKASNKANVYVVDQTNNNILDVTAAWGWKTVKVEKMCGGGGGGPTSSSSSCPSGFVSVGSYCIEPTMSSIGKTWYEAAVACTDKGAQLCHWSQWSAACLKGKLTDVVFGASGKYEWIDDYSIGNEGIADPIVHSDCKYLSRQADTTTASNTAYRCCTNKS